LFFLIPAMILAIAPTTYGQADNADLLAAIVRSERGGAGLDGSDYLCVRMPTGKTATKKLLALLQSRGLRIHKASKRMFRGYEIAIETPLDGAVTSIRVKTIDLRYKGTDLGIILRDGRYTLAQTTDGNRATLNYEPILPQSISDGCPQP
jgi:hypothetical protein